MKKIYVTTREADCMRANCIDELTGTTEWDSFVFNSELRGEEVIETGENDEED